MKHINYFETAVEQTAAIEKDGLNRPQVDYCLETNIVSYYPISSGNVGDFYYSDGTFSDIIEPSKGAPIGIVVIPRNFIQDSPKGRIMSLVNMSLSGFKGTTEDELMTSDGWSNGWNEKYNSRDCQFPLYSVDGDTINTNVNSGYVCTTIASDRWKDSEYMWLQSPEDPQAYYTTQWKRVSPSPYLANGWGELSLNPTYADYSILKNGNVLSDFDGYGNTDLQISNSAETDWKTAETITQSEGTASFACACKRFNVGGLDWYLPSCGESGFLLARFKTIQAQLQKLKDKGIEVALLNESEYNLMPTSTYNKTANYGYCAFNVIYSAEGEVNGYIPRAFALI